jgi:hypothetical protein
MLTLPRALGSAAGIAAAALITAAGATAAPPAPTHAHSAASSAARSASAAANKFAPFLRGWYGHDRILDVNKQGVVHEKFLTGCCPPMSRYTLQLSHVHRDADGHPVARVKVTKVRIDHGGYRFPGVHKGSTGRAVIKHHVYKDTLLKSTFCDQHAPAGTCGA